jgi:endonuclease VIII
MFCHTRNMPEGPSIIILKEAVNAFNRKKVLKATGNAKIDFKRINNKTIVDFKTWGKHFLICFEGFYLRIHLLMFGTYRINEKKDAQPRLHLEFKKGELNFYTCSVQLIEKDPDEVYDWSADIMSNEWNARKAMNKLKKNPETLVCDALLDQDIFSGLGNIIKNEVLFRTYIHPESKVGKLPLSKRKELLKEAVQYAFDFLKWKKAFVFKKHWLVNGKKICPRCNIPLHKKYSGKTKRITFFCTNCQVLYL